MRLKIYYTPRSKETLVSVYEFINQNFGEKSANTFVEKAEKIVKLISDQPYMYKASIIDEQVRVGLISKQTTLFYHISNDTVRLLFFWDNRQEPFNLIIARSQ